MPLKKFLRKLDQTNNLKCGSSSSISLTKYAGSLVNQAKIIITVRWELSGASRNTVIILYTGHSRHLLYGEFVKSFPM